MARLLVIPLVALLAGACSSRPSESPAAAQGDPQKGRDAFVRLQCHTCHEVVGSDLPAPSIVPPVALGGRSLLPPSREYIQESILLPSSHFAQGYPLEHIMAQDRSRMPDYSEALTNTQVADLVAYLESQYSLGIPSPTRR
jgi:mono/diheme cytochrome c family protein